MNPRDKTYAFSLYNRLEWVRHKYWLFRKEDQSYLLIVPSSVPLSLSKAGSQNQLQKDFNRTPVIIRKIRLTVLSPKPILEWTRRLEGARNGRHSMIRFGPQPKFQGWRDKLCPPHTDSYRRCSKQARIKNNDNSTYGFTKIYQRNSSVEILRVENETGIYLGRFHSSS